jgi:hypothetical protein
MREEGLNPKARTRFQLHDTITFSSEKMMEMSADGEVPPFPLVNVRWLPSDVGR